MNRKTVIIIALQAFIIVVLFWVLVFYGKDEYEAYTRGDEEEIETPSRVSMDNGATVVTLSPQTQQQSDIRTAPLKAGTHQDSFYSYGSVIGIEPLIDLRSRYLAAQAEANVARASLANSKQEYQRLLELNRDNRNISDRAVLAAEATRKEDEARLLAAESAVSSIRDSIRQSWGEVLAQEATKPASDLLQRLLQYRDVLLQVTLPFDYPTPRQGTVLTVTPSGTAGKTIQARFLSASPQTDSALQGKTYFFYAPADDLRVGMRVMARMTNSGGKAVTGVIVPDDAIVWYGGQAWIYRKEGNDRFVRQAVDTDREVPGGWFITALKPGQLVVVRGAQLLLSEEFKYQITNENED